MTSPVDGSPRAYESTDSATAKQAPRNITPADIDELRECAARVLSTTEERDRIGARLSTKFDEADDYEKARAKASAVREETAFAVASIFLGNNWYSEMRARVEAEKVTP